MAQMDGQDLRGFKEALLRLEPGGEKNEGFFTVEWEQYSAEEKGTEYVPVSYLWTDWPKRYQADLDAKERKRQEAEARERAKVRRSSGKQMRIIEPQPLIIEGE